MTTRRFDRKLMLILEREKAVSMFLQREVLNYGDVAKISFFSVFNRALSSCRSYNDNNTKMFMTYLAFYLLQKKVL